MKLSIKLLLILTLPFSINVFALDTFGKAKQQRPENLNIDNPVYSSSRAIFAEYQLTNKSIPLNKIHSWTLTLTHRTGKPITNADIVISPDMPEHLHGMTTKPVAIETDVDGTYLMQGMNFHMPGWWKITLDISGYGSRDLVKFNVIVGEDSPHEMQNNHH